MPSEYPNFPEPENGLIIRPSTGLVKLADGGSSAISEIVNRSLVHIQTSKTLGRLHRIGEHELHWPDYQLVCFWAEQLNTPPAAALAALFEPIPTRTFRHQTTLINGRFVNMNLGPRLKGIKGLPSIEGLRIKFFLANDLGLCALNLSPVPNLILLRSSGNQLTDLDLSPVPNLTQLICSENQLTYLDLSQLPNLTMLTCDENQLTDLDLSAVPNLTNLFCGENKLTDLDLSAVPNLTELFCDENQLTNLDLSAVPNLTELFCHHNQLTDLDLSAVPNLTRLWCAGKELIELDIRPLRFLKDLDCGSVRLIQRPDQNFK